MGGVVKGVGNAVGDVIGGASGAIGGALGFVPGIGPYLGPAVTGALLGPAAGFKSLAFNAATGQYGGGSGGGASGGTSVPQYAQPSYNYGANSYQMGNNPVDTSKYFVTGDRGVYNLLPALGQITPKTLQPSSLMYGSSSASDQFNKSYFTPYEAYQELSAQMQNDPKALAAFQSMYQPTTPTSKGISPYVDFGLGSSIGNNATYGDIASYASTNQNPFYVPFKGTAGRGGKISTFTAPPSYYEARRQNIQQRQQALNAMTPEQQAARRQEGMQRFMQFIRQRPTTPTPASAAPTPARLPFTRPAPVTPAASAPTPTPVTPTPTPVTPPSYPGITATPFNMAQGGIATLRRR